MKSFAKGAAVLLSLAAAPVAARRTSVGQNAEAYPVSGVVELLTQMKADIEKEADADEEVYDKLACWCETNDKSKTKAITDAESRLSDLGSTIEKTTALSASLGVEIDGLGKEVTKNKESLAVATALRKKQSAEFVAEEKEMIQSIRALGAAVVVLSKHHKAGALLSTSALASIASTASVELKKHAALLQGTITPRQRRAIQSLTQQQAPDYSGATPTFKQAYKPQSGEVFGILTEMKQTFEADLSQSQKEEVQAQQTYEALKAAKETEIQTGESSLQDKQQQLAAADEKLAEAKEDREDTKASLSADQKFLMDLKLKCSMTDKEWQERQKTRQAELAAVTEAISILHSDDSRDLFSKTFAEPSLVQTAVSRGSAGRARAAAELDAAARRLDSPRLSALATSARLDAFTKVKKAIDDMVTQLLKEKEEEIKHRDMCIKELNKNQLDTEKKVHTKTTLESKISGLELTIQGLDATITGLKSEISDLQTAQKRAKEDRELESKEFTKTVADQREAQKLLKQALTVLKRAFAETPASLVQKARRAAGPPAPEGFKKYEKHGSGGGVLAMIEGIIANAKTMEQETMKAEQDAKDAYTKLVQETTDAVKVKNDSITDRSSEKSSAEQDLIQAKSELQGAMDELDALSKNKGALKGSCDYVLKNFELRQTARDEEVKALREAKAFLSGMEA